MKTTSKTTQRKPHQTVQRASAGPDGASLAPPNRTGLPDELKSGVESLSGLAMDDVRVHYNSHKPADLQALAYAQGTDIHVGPGQERHLPHEAWHVVQQKQGRVKPTAQMKGSVPVNDNAGLEHEADVMGSKSLLNTIQRKGEEEDEEPAQGKFDPAQRKASQPFQLKGTGASLSATPVVQMERFVNDATSRIHLHLDIGTQDHLKIDGQRYNLMNRNGYDPQRVATARRALRRAPNVPDRVACQRELRGMA